jgi:hypothetical protein
MPTTTWRKSSYSDTGGGTCVEVALTTEWRKSSVSQGGGSDCVEVALSVTGALLRDSKDPSGGEVRLPVHAWRRFVAECSGAVDS